MDLDVRTIMVFGVLLSLMTAVLFVQVSRGFPIEHRRHLRTWTVALSLQPLAWLALSLRGQIPDLVSIGLGTTLLLASYAEMTRAVRGFQGLPERRRVLWAWVLAVVAVNLAFTPDWPHSSVRVVVNSLAGGVLLAALSRALLGTPQSPAGHAGRATSLFAALGVAALLWRVLDHAFWPRMVGGLLEAGASDLMVFLYANTAVIFLSLGFVLMHAERAYAALHQSASVDTLTGVLARSMLEAHGQRLVAAAHRSGRPLSALLLDLDRFKSVNDRLGHEAGDSMLKHLAEQAHRVLRGEDVLCRLGGDEFVVLLPHTDANGARIVAERLRLALREAPLTFKGQELPIVLSIGVADATGTEANLDRLIKRADEAMYIAKRAGGDRVHLAAPPP